MLKLRSARCPCCQFPTLSANNCYEICVICWWEDDGQGDHNANDVRGGPNGHYSLQSARTNFLHHGHMYDLGEGISGLEHPSQARQALLDYVRESRFDPNQVDAARLAELLSAVEQYLENDDRNV